MSGDCTVCIVGAVGVSGDRTVCIVGAVTIAIALYLLWGVIGPSSMAGLAVLLILVPVNGVIMGYFAKLQVRAKSSR